MKRIQRIPTVLVLLLSVLLLVAAGSTPLAQAAEPKEKQKSAVVTALSSSSEATTSRPSSRSTATVNVKDYGAVGNGQADDTAAIQRALDAGAGKQVIVPTGTYKVRPLRIRTTTTLSLDPQATLILAPGSKSDLITVTAPGATLTGSGTLDGNRAAKTSGAGIVIGGINDVTVRGIRIVNTASYGIYAANVATLDISGVSVSNTGYIGIFAQATWGQIRNLVIENSLVRRSSGGGSIVEGGIEVHRTGTTSSVSGVWITGNTVVMPKGPLDQTAVAIETGGGVQGAVVQNNITTGGSMGISLDRTTNGLVTGNSVSGASMYGIELASSISTTVSRNTVQGDGYTPRGIVLNNAGPTDDTISGNIISGCVGWGILLNTGSDRTTIADNRISQSKGYALDVIKSTGVTITANVADGAGMELKALVIDTSSHVTVTGNRFANFTQNGVLLYGASPAVLDQINITFNTFSKTNIAYGVQLSGGATLGIVLFRNNTVT